MKVFQKNMICVFLLVIAASIAYANSLGGDFVYDDKAMILAYDLVKDIVNLPRAFVSSTSVYGNVNYYRPLQTASYMVDYFLWGRFAGGFHFTNLLLHIACVVTLFFFLNILFRQMSLSFLTAVMFAVHPIHAAIVSYIAGRADSMLAFSMLACFICYAKYRYLGRSSVWSLVSLAFFTIALLCKELAMVVPFALLLFERYGEKWTELKRTPGTRSSVVPLFVILGGYMAFRFRFMSFFVEGAVEPFPLSNRIMTLPYVIGQYFRLIFLPNDLHMGRMPWVTDTIFAPKVMVSGLVVACVIYFSYRFRRKAKPLWFGLCWFFVMILPSLNVITPLFYTFAESWLYIPSIGLFLGISFLLVQGYRSASQRKDIILRYGVVLAGVFFVSAMTLTSIGYNRTWKNEITLAENTLKHNPREFKVYNNLGVAYLGRGELDEAEHAFRKCLEIKPDTGMAYFNLYRVYMAKGKRAEAVGYLKEARRLDPHRVNILIEKMGIRD